MIVSGSAEMGFGACSLTLELFQHTAEFQISILTSKTCQSPRLVNSSL